MTINHLSDKEFIDHLTGLILANLEDENLCVKDVTEKSGMSTHALNQRLLTICQKHLNQFIREIRLKKALELLQKGTFTASEVAFQVGFSSPAYFNKCFHDFYGYPPGKVKIQGIQGEVRHGVSGRVPASKAKEKQKIKVKIISLSLLLLLIITSFSFDYIRRIIKSSTAEILARDNERMSVAVMPFRNMTNDSEWNIWQEGIQSCIINSLSNSSDLVLQSDVSINNILKSEKVTDYAALKPDLAGNISRKLGAKVFIYGNITRSGPTVRINAQLIDSGDEEVFSSIHIDGSEDELLQSIDSLSVLINNALVMSEFRNIRPAEMHNYKNYSTRSTEAYKSYIYGNLAFYRNDFSTATDLYLQALAKDSTFYKPMAKIALAYYNENNYEPGKDWCNKYYDKKDVMNLQDKIEANVLYAVFYGTYFDRIKYLRQLLGLDDQNPMTWFNIGDCYYEMMQYEDAIPEFEKALELFKKFGTKPYWGAFYYELGISYHKTGQFKKEKKLYRKAEEDFPGDPGLMDQQAWLELSLGNYDEANQYIDRWMSIRREEGWTEAHIASYMAYIYSMADMPDKEEQCLRNALYLEPGKISKLNNLAYFLIDKERNIDEGVELVKNALQLAPDNFNSLHILGYALYKQGKYPDAVDLMQKSWTLRMAKSIYNHRAFLQLEEAKKALLNPQIISPV
jgi:tetratricopeptide (TPR) repeat protein/AraC-like DNA-binding protein